MSRGVCHVGPVDTSDDLGEDGNSCLVLGTPPRVRVGPGQGGVVLTVFAFTRHTLVAYLPSSGLRRAYLCRPAWIRGSGETPVIHTGDPGVLQGPPPTSCTHTTSWRRGTPREAVWWCTIYGPAVVLGEFQFSRFVWVNSECVDNNFPLSSVSLPKMLLFCGKCPSL